MISKLVEVEYIPGPFRVENTVTMTDVNGISHEAYVPICVFVQDENGRFCLRGHPNKDGVVTLHFPSGTINTGVNFVQVKPGQVIEDPETSSLQWRAGRMT